MTNSCLSNYLQRIWLNFERSPTALVRQTLEQELGKIQAQEIAKKLQIHWTTVYRYRRRLLEQELASAALLNKSMATKK